MQFAQPMFLALQEGVDQCLIATFGFANGVKRVVLLLGHGEDLLVLLRRRGDMVHR